jgi:hypothetical protein
MRLLCYADTLPLLRVLDLESMAVQPWATPWDECADGAISCVCVRRDWLALSQVGGDVIAMPDDLGNPGRSLGRSSYTPVPALDPRGLWLCDRDGPNADHVARAVDGAGGTLRELEVPGGHYLRAETEAGFVLQRDGAGTFLWDERGEPGRQLSRGGWFLGVAGDTVVWEDKPGRPPMSLVLANIAGPPQPEVVAWDAQPTTLHLDALDGGRRREVVHPEVTRWGVSAAPSPSGTMLAIPFQAGQGSHGIAIVDVRRGEVRLAPARFPSHLGTPVWTPDERTVYIGVLAEETAIARVTLETMATETLPVPDPPLPIALARS